MGEEKRRWGGIKGGETEGKGEIVPFHVVQAPLSSFSLENILIPVFFCAWKQRDSARLREGKGDKKFWELHRREERDSEITRTSLLGKSLWQPGTSTHRPRRNCRQMEIQRVPRTATFISAHWTRR